MFFLANFCDDDENDDGDGCDYGDDDDGDGYHDGDDDGNDDGDGEDDGVLCSRLIHPLQLPRCIRRPPFRTKPTWYWERYGSLTWPPTTFENFDQTSHVHKLFLLQPAMLSVQEISPKYDQRLLNLFENRWHFLKSCLSQT